MAAKLSECVSQLLVSISSDPNTLSHGCSGYFGALHGDASSGSTSLSASPQRYLSAKSGNIPIPRAKLKLLVDAVPCVHCRESLTTFFVDLAAGRSSELMTRSGLVFTLVAEKDAVTIKAISKQGKDGTCFPGSELVFDVEGLPLPPMVIGQRFPRDAPPSFLAQLRAANRELATRTSDRFDMVKVSKEELVRVQALIDKAFRLQEWVRVSCIIVGERTFRPRRPLHGLSFLQIVVLDAVLSRALAVAAKAAIRLCELTTSCGHFLGAARSYDSLDKLVGAIDASASPGSGPRSADLRDNAADVRSAARLKAVNRSALLATSFLNAGVDLMGPDVSVSVAQTTENRADATDAPSSERPDLRPQAPSSLKGAKDSDALSVTLNASGVEKAVVNSVASSLDAKSAVPASRRALTQSVAQHLALKSVRLFNGLQTLRKVLASITEGVSTTLENLARVRLTIADASFVGGVYQWTIDTGGADSLLERELALCRDSSGKSLDPCFGSAVLRSIDDVVSAEGTKVAFPDSNNAFTAALGDALVRLKAYTPELIPLPSGDAYDRSISIGSILLLNAVRSQSSPLRPLWLASRVDASEERCLVEVPSSELDIGFGFSWLSREWERMGDVYSGRLDLRSSPVATCERAASAGTSNTTVFLVPDAAELPRSEQTAAVVPLTSSPATAAVFPRITQLSAFLDFSPVERARSHVLMCVTRIIDHLVNPLHPVAKASDIANFASAAVNAMLIYIHRIVTWRQRAMSVCVQSLKALEQQQHPWFSSPLVLDACSMKFFADDADACILKLESMVLSSVRVPQTSVEYPDKAGLLASPLTVPEPREARKKPGKPVAADNVGRSGTFRVEARPATAEIPLLPSESVACSLALTVLFKEASELSVKAYNGIDRLIRHLAPNWTAAPQYEANLNDFALSSASMVRCTMLSDKRIIPTLQAGPSVRLAACHLEANWRLCELTDDEKLHCKLGFATVEDVNRVVTKITLKLEEHDKTRKLQAKAALGSGSTLPPLLPLSFQEKVNVLLSDKGVTEMSLALYAVHLALRKDAEWLMFREKDPRDLIAVGLTAFNPPVIDERTGHVALLITSRVENDPRSIGVFAFRLLPHLFDTSTVHPRSMDSTAALKPPSLFQDYAVALTAASDAASNALLVLEDFATLEQVLQLAQHHLSAIVQVGARRAATLCCDPHAVGARAAGVLLHAAALEARQEALVLDLTSADAVSSSKPSKGASSRKSKATSSKKALSDSLKPDASAKVEIAEVVHSRLIDPPATSFSSTAALLDAGSTDGNAASDAHVAAASKMSSSAALEKQEVSPVLENLVQPDSSAHETKTQGSKSSLDDVIIKGAAGLQLSEAPARSAVKDCPDQMVSVKEVSRACESQSLSQTSSSAIGVVAAPARLHESQLAASSDVPLTVAGASRTTEWSAPQLPASAGARPFAPSIDPAMLLQQARDEELARAISEGRTLAESSSEQKPPACELESSEPIGEPEVAEWENPRTTSKKKKGKDALAVDGLVPVADVNSVGLGNRYGENNCYLNVVAQTLFRVQGFRARFTSMYTETYRGVRHIASVAALPLDSREISSCLLLSAVYASIRGMAGGTSSSKAVSMNPLRHALYTALIAREVALATAPTSTRAVAAQLATRAMADASEVMEELITLMHESEAIVTAAAAGVSASALHAASMRIPDSAGNVPVMLHGCFSTALELSDGSSFTSVALSTFGMLLLETSYCRSMPCDSPPLTYKFTGLAQHINTSELLALKGASPTMRWDRLIHSIIEESDSRACVKCGTKPLRVCRTLVKPAFVVTVVLGWQSSHEPPERLWPVLDCIDGVIDMRVAFPGAALTHSLPAFLRGMICFINSHWVAFFKTPQGWVCTNDERIFPVEQPIAQCKQHRLQPSILLFECGIVGDSIPGDRGRSELHGSAQGSASRMGIAGDSAAVEAARAVLNDPAAFPTLGSSHATSGGVSTAVPSPHAAPSVAWPPSTLTTTSALPVATASQGVPSVLRVNPMPPNIAHVVTPTTPIAPATMVEPITSLPSVVSAGTGSASHASPLRLPSATPVTESAAAISAATLAVAALQAVKPSPATVISANAPAHSGGPAPAAPRGPMPTYNVPDTRGKPSPSSTGPTTSSASASVQTGAGPAASVTTVSPAALVIGAGPVGGPVKTGGPATPVKAGGPVTPVIGAGPAVPVKTGSPATPVKAGAGPVAPVTSMSPAAPVLGAGPAVAVKAGGPATPVKAGAVPATPVLGAGPAVAVKAVVGAGPAVAVKSGGPVTPVTSAGPAKQGSARDDLSLRDAGWSTKPPAGRGHK